MAFLEWSSRLALGIPEMDTQHRQWLEILNRFYDQLADRDRTAALALWEDVLQFTLYHFREEEYFLAAINYPYYQEQRLAHREIRDQLLGFKAVLNSGSNPPRSDWARVMRSWFQDHILVQDLKYCSYFSRYQKHQPVLN